MEFTEEELQAVIFVLKKHFNNLSVTQVLSMAFEILRALKDAKSKDETQP